MDGHYVADAIYIARGDLGERVYLLHDAEVTADVDLDTLIGARGTTAGVHLLATAGGRPNDAAGTLQGIDNIEVGSHRLKLYEAWVEQAFAGGRASLRIGLTDLNADFYQNDSAGLLMAPAFGIGSELAATGPNGPSIFPSTALTARVSVQLGKQGYARAAVVDAKSGVLGDPDGVDFTMRDGALVIGEVGLTTNGKIALGAWRYTRRQDDIFATGLDGAPVKRIATGAYLLLDQKVAGSDARATNLFLRVGLSEGKTTPFRGGFQTGVIFAQPVASRPDSQVSFGVQHGALSRGYRDALRDAGTQSDASEWGLELTYSDKINRYLTVQPDVQYVRRAFGNGRDTLVFGLRLTVSRPDGE
ncbi:carbohydrate porin [Sphingomonas sp. MMS12-HWE2-04]|uniref:carbohydrate porin n=1 Tax=Sphingomonas sp. MMS12-HWE2-04 TaxID=3234199 RepID=UPI00384BE01F